MRKKFTMLLASLLAFVGVMKADVTDLPRISTVENPIYYTIVNTRSSQPGGLMYWAGDNVGMKDEQAIVLENKHKFFFTGSHDAMYVHNAATGKKLATIGNGNHAAGSWTAEGTEWAVGVSPKGGGLAFGPKGGLNGNGCWNECNYQTAADKPDFTTWSANDDGSIFIVDLVEDYVFPVSNLFYVIEAPLFEKVQGVKKALYVNAEGKAVWGTEDLTNHNFYWIPTVDAEGKTVALKNLGTGTYLSKADGTMTTEAATATLKILGDCSFNINIGGTIHANNHGNGNGDGSNLVNWGGGIGSASAWTFVKKNDPTASQNVVVKYSFTYGGVEKYAQETNTLVGEEWPAITTTFPFGVSATKPAGEVSAEGAVGGVVTKEIELTVNLPFVPAADYASVTNWYYLKFDAYSNSKYYLYHTVGADHISLNKQSLDAKNLDLYTWGFVGNPFDGFKVVNKAAGADMILSSSTTMEGQTGSGTWPIMTSTSASALDGKNEYWVLSNSTHAEGGFYMEQKGYSNNKLNNRDGKLAYWTGGSGPGSTMVVEAQAAADLVDLANGYLNMKGVGYPADNSSARTALSNAVAVKHEANINAAIVSFKTSQDITLPVDGKAYTFMNVMGNKEHTQRYMKYENGKKLSVSTSADDASVFVCRELRTGVYAFVTEDGKILTWVGNDESGAYKEEGQTEPFGYSSYYATSYDTKADWNEISVEKYGTDEGNFGHLHMYGRRNKSGLSAIIVKHAEDRFDQSNNTRYFNADFSSAWILTEVERTNNDERDLALARVGAKNTIGNRTFDEGIGKYHYVVGGQNVYAALNVDKIATIDEINAAVATIAINQPAAGFYRIKSMNGNNAEKKGRFLEADATGMKLAKNGGNPDNKYTSVFYVKDNTILSYSCGQYLNSYGAFDAVGAEPTSWVIQENAKIVGTYALKYNAANDGYLSDWFDIPAATEDNPQPVFAPTNGLNDANAAWTLEEVTWLPVAMNAEIGYATLYSPVPLALSYGRVKAYTAGTVNGDCLTLNEQTAVPANQGVVLVLQEGKKDDVEDGYVFLQVQKSDVEVVGENAFSGTFATKAAPTNEGTIYTLQREQKKNENGDFVPNEYTDNVVFGIYTGTNLNGFRAYLPISTSTPAGSISIRFEGSTDIENVEIRNEHSEMIFDLLGRRVEAITKGGIYIVNGKKVIK